jgi:thiol-disulfide isomerase/thioredoxin
MVFICTQPLSDNREGNAMLARLRIGSLLILMLALGCVKAEPKPNPAKPKGPEKGASEKSPSVPSEKTPAKSAEKSVEKNSNATAKASDTPSESKLEKTTEPAAVVESSKSDDAPKLKDADDDEDENIDDLLSMEKEKELLARLEKDPKDGKALLLLAKIKQTKGIISAQSGKPDYKLFKEAAEYLHKAIAADEKVKTTKNFNLFASIVFYGEACCLALDKDESGALKSLQLSVDYGWSNDAHMKKDPDLKLIRESDEFKRLVGLVREKRAQKQIEVVAALFDEKPDFKFEFDLKDTAGKPVSKKDFTGKVLIVNIWGTWCPPCRAEIPDLVASSKKYQPQGVEFIGLNSESSTGDEADELIKQSQEKMGITYPCALGNDKVFSQVPGFSGFPTTLFFNREGVIQAKLVGMTDELTLELIIERLLKESPDTKSAEASK